MQGRKENIIYTSDKMEGFKKKNLFVVIIHKELLFFMLSFSRRIHNTFKHKLKTGIKKYNV